MNMGLIAPLDYTLLLLAQLYCPVGMVETAAVFNLGKPH